MIAPLAIQSAAKAPPDPEEPPPDPEEPPPDPEEPPLVDEQ
jgi:hypothetical protein